MGSSDLLQFSGVMMNVANWLEAQDVLRAAHVLLNGLEEAREQRFRLQQMQMQVPEQQQIKEQMQG